MVLLFWSSKASNILIIFKLFALDTFCLRRLNHHFCRVKSTLYKTYRSAQIHYKLTHHSKDNTCFQLKLRIKISRKYCFFFSTNPDIFVEEKNVTNYIWQIWNPFNEIRNRLHDRTQLAVADLFWEVTEFICTPNIFCVPLATSSFSSLTLNIRLLRKAINSFTFSS